MLQSSSTLSIFLVTESIEKAGKCSDPFTISVVLTATFVLLELALFVLLVTTLSKSDPAVFFLFSI